jgi:hypothetical protein
MEQFKKKFGNDIFEESNNEYNDKMSDCYLTLQSNKAYQKLSNDDKQRYVTKKRSQLKKQIIENYGFEYDPEETTELPPL